MSDVSMVPAALRPTWERLQKSLPAGDLPAPLRDSLPKVWLCSEFAAQACARHPEWLHDPVYTTTLTSAESPAERVAVALQHCPDEDALMRTLREQRAREMLRIAWRDLAGWASLAQTLQDLSGLADACVQGALVNLARWHAERHGVARNAQGDAQALVVLGLGKLGARELNFSSDIDLVLAYPENGTSDGAHALDNEEYFLRLGQKLTRALSEVTADGFVFRVDLRLRPFGESGPLALSFAALETYYQNHGREWERYALIKARPVAGDVAAGERLLQTLRPFVYRRYLDFNAFDALREMKQLIMQDVARRRLEDNIKLGRGGIREIEFVGQVFQLIRGGREPALREPVLLPVLHYLGQSGYLGTVEAQTLAGAYEFLRRVENRLQQYRDAQTHALPRSDEDRARLAWGMDFPDWPSLHAALEEQRRNVQRIFEQVFVAPRPVRERHSGESPLAAIWRGALKDEEAQAQLAAAGFTQTAELLQDLGQLQTGSLLRALGERGQRQMRELVPRLLEAAAHSEHPDATFRRLLQIVEAIAKRSAYLALLLERPVALEHLARLVAGSHWLAELVARSPLLLDELMDPRIFSEFPTQESLRGELDAALAEIAPEDLEAQMDALRRFQQAAVVRVAAADLADLAPLMKVSDFLTWIAEQVIRKALDIAWWHMRARHGEPRCQDEPGERPAHFAVIAYGKLAGLELGYASDLDLVFLHDSAGERQQSHGPRPLDNSEYFTRLAQRAINILSIPTTSGVMYQVDTRLRPSGAAGLIVSVFESFARYQREQAWTWEHQALLRSRPVAGDAEVGAAFESLRREVLGRPRDAEALRREVAEMRARMLREQSSRAEEFDLKQDAGGLTDIEFLVQYWVLANAAQHPALLDWPDNIRNLEGLMAEKVIAVHTGEFLTETYKTFRQLVHRKSLEGQAARIPAVQAEPQRGQVRTLWASVFGTESPEPAQRA
ncbi:MAG: bifunctional [glutamate--ammonia ligase]-adenylyl-L-tyrosine phosphorylase/[glutamate--ammonia-ligase] adenylyltransferase [Gammaproteobacteria bacterium]